jgi:hypothetical protein
MNKISSAQPFLYGEVIESLACAFDIIISELKKSGTLEEMQSPLDLILDVRICM